MPEANKNILIFDEERFSRVCSAILDTAGYGADTVSQAHLLPAKLNDESIRLIVTSYPFGAFLFHQRMRGPAIPMIILSDNVDEELINILKGCENVYCMIKPVDYDHFKKLVSQVVGGRSTTAGGYSLV